MTELRRTSAVTAGVLVVASAVVTMVLLAAIDNVLSANDTGSRPSAAQQPTPEPIELGQAYPKPAPKAAAPPGAEAEEPAAATPPNVPLRRLVGQKIIVRMRGTAPS